MPHFSILHQPPGHHVAYYAEHPDDAEWAKLGEHKDKTYHMVKDYHRYRPRILDHDMDRHLVCKNTAITEGKTVEARVEQNGITKEEVATTEMSKASALLDMGSIGRVLGL